MNRFALAQQALVAAQVPAVDQEGDVLSHLFLAGEPLPLE
jgi:hypothetical protein